MKNRVEFVATLNAKQERIKIIRHLRGGKALASLYRHDRLVSEFVVSPGQLRKIEKQEGRLSITRMIEAGHRELSPYGR